MSPSTVGRSQHQSGYATRGAPALGTCGSNESLPTAHIAQGKRWQVEVRNKNIHTYISIAVINGPAGSFATQCAFLALFVLGCTQAAPSASGSASASSVAALASNSGETSVSSASPSAIPTSSVVSSAPAQDKRAGMGGGNGNGSGGKRFGEATLYVDGKPNGILRFLELPSKLVPRPLTLQDGRVVQRYRLIECVEALGIPLSKVKEIHLMGGRNRTSVIAREELVKHRDDLLFSFTKGDAGKPRVHWPPIKTNTSIDMISAMVVYVDAVPPHFDPTTRKMRMPDNTVVDGVPYAKPEEMLRGTRVYGDAGLAGAVKRKRLPDAVLSARYTRTNPRFSLEKYLRSIGIDPAGVDFFAVVQGDALVERLTGEAWRKIYKTAEFSLAQGSEGKAILHYEKDGKEVAIEATSVFAFGKNKAPQRLVTGELSPVRAGSTASQPEPADSEE